MSGEVRVNPTDKKKGTSSPGRRATSKKAPSRGGAQNLKKCTTASERGGGEVSDWPGTQNGQAKGTGIPVSRILFRGWESRNENK